MADAADVTARESYERIRAIFRPGVDKPSILRVLRGGNFLLEGAVGFGPKLPDEGREE